MSLFISRTFIIFILVTIILNITKIKFYYKIKL